MDHLSAWVVCQWSFLRWLWLSLTINTLFFFEFRLICWLIDVFVEYKPIFLKIKTPIRYFVFISILLLSYKSWSCLLWLRNFFRLIYHLIYGLLYFILCLWFFLASWEWKCIEAWGFLEGMALRLCIHVLICLLSHFSFLKYCWIMSTSWLWVCIVWSGFFWWRRDCWWDLLNLYFLDLFLFGFKVH